MKKKQKEIFLEEEGNAWFKRNHLKIQNRKMDLQDPIINALTNFLDNKDNKKLQLLEIGCGEGKRLSSPLKCENSRSNFNEDSRD